MKETATQVNNRKIRNGLRKQADIIQRAKEVVWDKLKEDYSKPKVHSMPWRQSLNNVSRGFKPGEIHFISTPSGIGKSFYHAHYGVAVRKPASIALDIETDV